MANVMDNSTQNGGFETQASSPPHSPFATWSTTVAGTSTVNAATGADVYTGSYALRLDIDASGSDCYVASGAILTVGHVYKVVFYAKISNVNAGASVQIYNGTSTVYVSLAWATYQQYTVYLLAASTHFSVERGANCASLSIWVDSIIVTDVTASVQTLYLYSNNVGFNGTGLTYGAADMGTLGNNSIGVSSSGYGTACDTDAAASIFNGCAIISITPRVYANGLRDITTILESVNVYGAGPADLGTLSGSWANGNTTAVDPKTVANWTGATAVATLIFVHQNYSGAETVTGVEWMVAYIPGPSVTYYGQVI